MRYQARLKRVVLLPTLCVALAACSEAPNAPGLVSDDEGLAGKDPSTGTLDYEFGALFEPPRGRVVHGMGQWIDGNPQYAALFPVDKQPAAELVFVDLGDTPRGWEPDKIAERIAGIRSDGRIPVMDLALRGLQPGSAALSQMEDKTYGIDSVIATSSLYDARIQSFVDVLKDHGSPVMLRIGGEFSGSWNGYHPYAYPEAFRKIVQMFRDAGVKNVAFVWCYEPAAADDFDHFDANGKAKWYPGDAYVDWFSIDLFSASDVGGPISDDDRGSTSYGRTLRFLDMAVKHKRPVIIAESSPSHFDVSNAAGAALAWSEWFEPLFSLIESRSEIKWFHYINYDWTKASYYASTGWKNNDIALNAQLASQYVKELKGGRFLHASELALLKGY